MIRISARVRQKIIEHARRDAPIEACGYLVGRRNSVIEFIPMRNSDNSPEHYSFDPEEQFKVLKKVREQGLDVIGAYHSHPKTPARMSEEDIRLAYDTSISYVIVSLADIFVDIRSFRINNDKVKEVKLKVFDA